MLPLAAVIYGNYKIVLNKINLLLIFD